jgi:hypothetical protein
MQPILTSEAHITALISNKAYASVAFDFREQHQSALLAMLPASARTAAQQQPLPACLSSFTDVIRVAGQPHSYQATASSWSALKEALSAIQKQTGTHFNCDHRETQGCMMVQRHSCTFGGRASFLERAERVAPAGREFKRDSSVGHSIKCQCPAHVTAVISLPYAHALQLTTLRGGAAVEATSLDTTVRVTINLGHRGHVPSSPADLVSLPTDPRLVTAPVAPIGSSCFCCCGTDTL